jgi:hypothetical protein
MAACIAVVPAMAAKNAEAEKLFAMTDKLEAQLPWDMKDIAKTTSSTKFEHSSVTSYESETLPKGSALRQVQININPREDGTKKWITSVHLYLSKSAPTIKLVDVTARYGKPSKVETPVKFSSSFSADWGYASSVTYAYKHKNCLLLFEFDTDHDKKLRAVTVAKPFESTNIVLRAEQREDLYGGGLG